MPEFYKYAHTNPFSASLPTVMGPAVFFVTLLPSWDFCLWSRLFPSLTRVTGCPRCWYCISSLLHSIRAPWFWRLFGSGCAVRGTFADCTIRDIISVLPGSNRYHRSAVVGKNRFSGTYRYLTYLSRLHGRIYAVFTGSPANPHVVTIL